MTAVCAGGGPSQPKAAFGSLVYMGPAAIGALMNNWPTPWAVGAAAWLGLITYDLTTFCPVDPPALPTLNASDYWDLVQLANPVARLAAVQKFEDWIGARVWHDLCECVSGAQPAPPSPPAAPVNWPTTDPGLPAANAPCSSFQRTGCTGMCSGSTSAWISALLTPGSTSYRLSSPGTIQSSGGCTYRYTMQEFGGVATITTDTTTDFAPGLAHEFIGTIRDPNSKFLVGNISYVSGGGCSCADDLLEIYCNPTAPGAPTSPCCPPDAVSQSYLEAILKMVTLIQRQSTPFGYVYGANHTGLSGKGSISVADLIGVSVDVTTTPAGTSSEDGVPVQYFDLGYVTLGTADGYSTSRRIDHDGTLFVPPSAGLYTLIGYTLGAGVVADIRELVREP